MHVYLKILTYIALLVINCSCLSQAKHGGHASYDTELAQNALIEELGPHIKNQRVLDAIKATPRHLFVPAELQMQAYTNQALAIGYGQTISQPLIVALMTEALEPDPNDRVLEIGTGSGYQAAVLSKLVKEVYTIEILRPLAAQTQELFKTLEISNIHSITADGAAGWMENAPYNSIIVTAAAPIIPEQLSEQLTEGGRLIIPIGVATQRLLLYTKHNGKLIQKDFGQVRFVPMTGTIRHKTK